MNLGTMMPTETTDEAPGDEVQGDAALGAYIASTAVLLGLPIEPAWHGPILFNLKTIAAAARLLESFPLADAAEPAPVYEA
jgi:hypothetical protein